MNGLADQIAGWLRSYMTNAEARGYVIGLSGGVDSATAAALAVRGVGRENVLGLIMPCGSDPNDRRLAQEVAEWLGIECEVIPLEPLWVYFLALTGRLELHERGHTNVSAGNIKARLRMITLYAMANQKNYLVLGTGNKSELEVGYFTKYGDGGVDVLPLGDLYKTEVWELAQEVGVPQKIIDRNPSAGLWVGQTDEDQMGITYDRLDAMLRREIKKEQHVLDMQRKALHKLEMPPIFRRVP